MFAEHNALALDIFGLLSGHAEGPLGIGGLLIAALALIVA